MDVFSQRISYILSEQVEHCKYDKSQGNKESIFQNNKFFFLSFLSFRTVGIISEHF